jgi:hypothetical protein
MDEEKKWLYATAALTLKLLLDMARAAIEWLKYQQSKRPGHRKSQPKRKR